MSPKVHREKNLPTCKEEKNQVSCTIRVSSGKLKSRAYQGPGEVMGGRNSSFPHSLGCTEFYSWQHKGDRSGNYHNYQGVNHTPTSVLFKAPPQTVVQDRTNMTHRTLYYIKLLLCSPSGQGIRLPHPILQLFHFLAPSLTVSLSFVHLFLCSGD